MQKVEGSNPFSRSRKRPAFAGLFSSRSRVVPLHPGRTETGLEAGRSSAASRKKAWFAGRFCSSEPKSFGGLQKVHVRPATAVTPPPAHRHDPADSARRGDTSGRGPWGRVRFQSGNRGSTSPRSATPASHGYPEPVSSLRRTAAEAAARAPHRGLVRGSHTGVIAEGVAVHRQAALCLRVRGAAAPRPERAPGRRRGWLPLAHEKQVSRPPIRALRVCQSPQRDVRAGAKAGAGWRPGQSADPATTRQ